MAKRSEPRTRSQRADHEPRIGRLWIVTAAAFVAGIGLGLGAGLAARGGLLR